MTSSPRLDAQTLMVHAPFLRALARSLVQDEAAAEDLVQHAWLRALEHPPADAGMLRSWLATVVRNLATDHRRSAAARDRREEANARRDHVPSVQDIAQREAMRKDVVDAVMRLPEPARSAVLLRYYEGMPPREIARILEVPVETVRTRIKRGLARLRADLDDHYGDRSLWSATLALIAFPKTAPSAGVATLASLLRLLVTPAGLAITAVIVLGGGSAWWVASTRDAADEAAAPRAAELADLSPSVVPVAEPRPDPAVAAVSSTPTEVERELEPLAVEGPGIRGRVHTVADADGRPLAYLTGIALTLHQPELLLEADQLADALFHRECRVDDDGRFRFEKLPDGLYYLGLAASSATRHQLSHIVTVGDVHPEVRALVRQQISAFAGQCGEAMPVFETLHSDRVVDVELTAAAPGRLTGNVVDHEGEVIAGAEVLAIPTFVGGLLQTNPDVLDGMVQHLRNVVQRAQADAEGRFRFEGPVGSTIVLARSPAHRPTRVDLDVATPDADQPLQIRLQPAVTFSVEGRVLDPEDRPLAGVVVVAARERLAAELGGLTEEQLERALVHKAVTDEDGRYSLIGRCGDTAAGWDLRADSGRALVVTALAAGCAPQTSAPLALDGGVEQRDFRLAPGGPIHVVVTDARGAAIEGASVDVLDGGDMLHRAGCDSRGLAELPSTAHGPYTLRVQHVGHETHRRVLDWSPTTGVVDVVLQPADTLLEGCVVDVDGQPVPRFLPLAPGLEDVQHQRSSYFDLRAYPVDPTDLLTVPEGTSRPMILSQASKSARLGQDGRYTIDLGRDWPSNEAFVVLEAGGLPAQVQQIAVGDRADFVLDVAAALGQRSRVQFKAFDAAAGAKLTDAGVDFYAEREQRGHAFYNTFGLMTGTITGGGRYDFRIRAPGHASIWIRDVDVAPGSVLEPFEIELEPESTLVVKVLPRQEDGVESKPRAMSVSLYDLEGRRIVGQSSDEAGTLVIPGLGPGSYHVHADDNRGAEAMAEVLILPQATSETTLRVEPCPQIVVELSARLRDAFQGGALRLRDRQGRRSLDLCLDHLWSNVVSTHALPGEYRLELVGAGIPRREADVTVPRDGSSVRLFFDLD